MAKKSNIRKICVSRNSIFPRSHREMEQET